EKAKIAAALGGSSSALANPLGAGADTSPFGNPLLRSASAEGEEPAAEAPSGDAMPQAMEATAGIASEIATHNESSLGNGDASSPEEQAMQTPDGGNVEQREESDEEGDTAALAEGRLDPPAASKDEPV